jgi:hypothetical protein
VVSARLNVTGANRITATTASFDPIMPVGWSSSGVARRQHHPALPHVPASTFAAAQHALGLSPRACAVIVFSHEWGWKRT